MDNLRNVEGKIRDARGRALRFRGVNLGSWLLVEGYMLQGPNEPEHRIRRAFAKRHGDARARSFFQRWTDVFIQAEDLRRIKRWGFNLVRVPFNHKLLDGSGGKLYARNGWDRIDWLVRQCSRLGLYCLLDMHGAPGGQNADWHSDSPEKARLWKLARFQNDTVDLWREIARRYKDEPAVAGYDLLNEPITDDKPALNRLYARCLEAIRSAGDRHLVFLEGTQWSTDFSVVAGLDDPQLGYTPHFYKPFQFTFNFVLDLVYPGRVEGKLWNRAALKKDLLASTESLRRRKAPILVGEFGVNSRCPVCRSEVRWVKDAVSVFEELGFHWTYWSYKVLSGHMHPSGLLRYPQNPDWIRREGVAVGWEAMARSPLKTQAEILRAMDSKHFVEDSEVLKLLRRGGKLRVS